MALLQRFRKDPVIDLYFLLCRLFKPSSADIPGSGSAGSSDLLMELHQTPAEFMPTNRSECQMASTLHFSGA